MDPADPFAFGGEDGAWDLGSNGTITLQVRIAAAPPQHAETRLFVDVLAYKGLGMLLLPTVVAGMPVLSEVASTQFERADTIGSWEHLLYEATLTATSDVLQLQIVGDAQGSIVDHLAVYVEVVPEPATVLLAVSGMAAALAAGWRRRVENARAAP